MPTDLSLRFLGEISLSRGGLPVSLPPSRKTRALLAYLALSGRPQRRERLCRLLWDVADDPRGALRWSLSRLRTVLDEPGRLRLRTEGTSVAFEPAGAWVDVLTLRERAAGGFAVAPLAELQALAELFRGELLEGLELDDFADFQAWCAAEREEARKLRSSLLGTLVERLRGAPEEALPHARVLATVDPRNAAARAGLVRLLLETGRAREAAKQDEAARHVLEEVGEDTGPLDEAWRRTRAAVPAAERAPRAPSATPRTGSNASPALFGRQAELVWLGGALETAAAGGRERVLLLCGEPGLGKSCLLNALTALARGQGATVLEGGAFEAEAGRPYGPWTDALRRLPADALAARSPELAPVLPGLAASQEGSRERLHDAVAALLASLGGRARPVLVAFDDVQWLDPASCELLHYVARTGREHPLAIVLSARAGELADNEAALRLVRGLRQLGLLEERHLQPLGPEDTAALVAAVAPGADAGSVFAESAGNPLLAAEVARSIALGEQPLGGTLVNLVRQRLERLPLDAAELLRWASVVGRGFDLERLRGLAQLELEPLLAALVVLERHGLLRSDPQHDGAYVFTHDVVRRAVYGELSGPRRRLMHLKVARALEAAGDLADVHAAELAHHAAQAGETGLAARACVRAGQRNLRVFAGEAALAMARRGRRYAESLPQPERTERLLELLQVELAARRPADVGAAAREAEALAERALDEGRPEHARLGYHLLAWLRWEQGLWSDARRHALRAEAVARAGGEREQVTAMAEAARCLALIERDLTHAEALALEARARAERLGARAPAISDAQGMLRLHEGRIDEAAALFEHARLGARQDGDRLAEFQALEHLVAVRQLEGAWDEAWRLCGDLVPLGEKLRGGSEGPFARALWALTRRALGHEDAGAPLDAAIEELRTADAKHRLAYALTRAAQLDLACGDVGRARARAGEALQAADALGRPTEALLAGITLARACAAGGDREGATRVAGELRGRPVRQAAAHARRALEELLHAGAP